MACARRTSSSIAVGSPTSCRQIAAQHLPPYSGVGTCASPRRAVGELHHATDRPGPRPQTLHLSLTLLVLLNVTAPA